MVMLCQPGSLGGKGSSLRGPGGCAVVYNETWLQPEAVRRDWAGSSRLVAQMQALYACHWMPCRFQPVSQHEAESGLVSTLPSKPPQWLAYVICDGDSGGSDWIHSMIYIVPP
jgi:hypothetical protein